MKSFAFLLCALCVSAFNSSVYAQSAGLPNNTGHGYQLNTRPDQGLGFYGATPIIQPSGSSQAPIGGVTGYVTAASLQQFVAAGHNGTGAVTLTGAPLGATVISVVNLTTPALASSAFESVLSVVNQIQQTSATNLSASTFLITVALNSATDLTAIKSAHNGLQSALQALGLIKGGN